MKPHPDNDLDDDAERRHFDNISAQAMQKRRTQSMTVAGAMLFIGLLVGAGIVWIATRHQHESVPVAVAPVQKAPPPPAADNHDQVEEKAAQAMSNAGMGTDEKLRADLAALSANPLWKSWLEGTKDIGNSAAVIIANVADDDDPRKRLGPLRPQDDFATVEQGGQTVESQASEERFDPAVAVIESVDAKAVAAIYRSIHPLVAVAYRAVAHPGVSLDRALGGALHRIEDAKVPQSPPALQKAGKLWIYNDPALEQEGPIEKLLFRMGQANQRKLQSKARELHAAIGVP